MLIDFLNSYRSFGFRSVQYQYMVNEFGLSDVETAYWLGVQSWLLVIFGMLGAVLVDAYGVRRTALASLSVAVVRRAMLDLRLFSLITTILTIAMIVRAYYVGEPRRANLRPLAPRAALRAARPRPLWRGRAQHRHLTRVAHVGPE